MSADPPGRFDVVAELDVPHRPDLDPVRRQVDALVPLTRHVLVPDNHTGRAAVSGVAVTVAARGAGATTVTVVLNARDRNRLGLRRDLLGLLALGVHDVLLLRGDRPDDPAQDGPLTVRAMRDEARDLAAEHGTTLRVGVVADLGRDLVAWKRDADAVYLAPAFSAERVVAWRARHTDLGVPVRAGVLVPTGPRMARSVADAMGLALPTGLLDALADDPDAGVDAACEHVLALRASGAVDGVHLVAVSRAAAVARRLAPLLD